jgi:hypothetical protein
MKPNKAFGAAKDGTDYFQEQGIQTNPNPAKTQRNAMRYFED